MRAKDRNLQDSHWRRRTVVPCEVGIGKRLGESCFSALTRACEERHLAVVPQMLFKYGFVYAFPGNAFHGKNDSIYGIHASIPN